MASLSHGPLRRARASPGYCGALTSRVSQFPRRAGQGAGHPGTSSAMQMEVGNMGSGNAIRAQPRQTWPTSPFPRATLRVSLHRLLAVWLPVSTSAFSPCSPSSLKTSHVHYLTQAPSRQAEGRPAGWAR